MTNVDELAQIIRQVDGNHSLGAGALAEAIIARLPHIAARQPVTMDDALAAGDGTLHGAIDHWQERALRAEAELAARQPVGEQVCSGGFVIANGSGEKRGMRVRARPSPPRPRRPWTWVGMKVTGPATCHRRRPWTWGSSGRQCFA